MHDVYQNRRQLMRYVVIAVVVIYILRLFYLQVLSKDYQQLARRNVIREITIFPPRGLIYDRNKQLLVANQNEYDLWVVPEQVGMFDTLFFCQLTGISDSLLRVRLKKAAAYSRYRPSLLVKGISVQQYASIQESLYLFPGFFGQVRTVRNYPDSTASHVLGYIGEVTQKQIDESGGYYRMGDYIGISGLELTYEELLRGRKGTRFVVVDVHNREQGSFQQGRFDTAVVTGWNLITTLDASLQRFGEALMRNKKGSIVAIDPSTGEILALVSSPTYDPNLLTGQERTKNFRLLATDTLKPLFVRPLKAAYPPGSTLKPLLALLGMGTGSITSQTGFSCANGYTVGSLHVACRHAGYLPDVVSALQVSCNGYFCHIFRKIVDDRRYGNVSHGLSQLKQAMEAFGLGVVTGVDLPNEGYGFVPDGPFYERRYGKNRFNSVTVISLGIGQGEIGLTPLQMANVTAAIANQGYWIQPHVVRTIEGPDSSWNVPVRRHAIPIDTVYFNVIHKGMRQAVEAGTGRVAKIPGVSVAGKTGTAQNPIGEDHSLFVGFAPVEDPRIAIAVVVENGGWGASWAAPIASLMIEKYLTDSISTERQYLLQRMMEGKLIP